MNRQPQSPSALEALRTFFRLESAGGYVLIAATALALTVANIGGLQHVYERILALHLTLTLGGFGLDKPLLLWINDALMALFFMLVGLELKREVVEGQLSRPDQVILPAMAALGGLVLPAVVYLWVNSAGGPAANGWAIPTATDIAFALAVLGLLGRRVPVSLKLFLTTIAIIDDIAAIVIIAVFYSSDLSLTSLLLAGLGVIALAMLNRMGVMRLAPYMLVGCFIWFCVLKSGVHATLAGVVVAMFVPLRADDDHSPARHLEHTLHPWVAFGVLPAFAFANAGVSLYGVGLKDIVGTVPLGIVLGLCLGKPLGVMAMIVLGRALGWAELPAGARWLQLLGLSLLCGIGFTMSLFIGTLAFEHGDFDLLPSVKVGVLIGSVVSALCGLGLLHLCLPKNGGRGQSG